MPPTDPDRKGAQIARINELSGLARTAWFSLLGYLVFVGITLLGVRDADFFVPTRRTDLPLVGVQIPTASFFWIAPVLGAALYTYLHLFLIKLWDAHGEARTTDADATHHWLVNDFVLLRKDDPTTRARSLSWLIVPITLLLVWAAGPIVLGFGWWRSMPAHNEGMTLLSSACLWFVLVVGFTSWRHAGERLDQRRFTARMALLMRSTAFALAVTLVGLSWLRTEGGPDRIFGGYSALTEVKHSVAPDALLPDWFHSKSLTLHLARANLAGVDLVQVPVGWREPVISRGAFREEACRREGLPMSICGDLYEYRREIPISLIKERLSWCQKIGIKQESLCTKYFSSVDRRFVNAWRVERTSTIREIAELDLRGEDLRRADARAATLVGANLEQARLSGADLRWARLEGAILNHAHLQEAILSFAQMERADLRWADLEGAILNGAQLTGANFRRARLSKASLSSSHLNEASFIEAKMSGSILNGATLERADLRGSNLEKAKFRGADFEYTLLRRSDLRRADWTGASIRWTLLHFSDLRGAIGLKQAQLEGAVGSFDTLLPGQPLSLFVWSCWEKAPPEFDALVARVGDRTVTDPLLCGREPRHKTGRTLQPSLPRPVGHLLDLIDAAKRNTLAGGVTP